MDTTATCTLPDGRTLGYATWGDPGGQPTIVCHGLPGSRFCGLYLDAPARAAGVRVITPERPGFGLSTRSAPRVLTDWPRDVEALADHLELPTFHLLGVSGGGPHALVCAALIPKRLRSVKVVVSFGPLDTPEATANMDPVLRRLWLSGPWFQRLVSRLTGFAARFLPDSALIPTRDEHAMRFFSQPEIRDAFMREIREAVRDGGRAMADEVAMLSHDWGFKLSDISIPVRLWAGETDRNCPIGMTRRLISQIPDVDATIFPGEGHMCAFERLDQLFELDRPGSTPHGTEATA
jgi:pimeloyl-ACP methyl ester carboxylesterase